MLTAEQYLEIERAAEFKSEYDDGRMFAISGGSIPHSKIAGQIIERWFMRFAARAVQSALPT